MPPRTSAPLSVRPVLTERLQSPAQQQSQEKYLVPRNSWIRITAILIRPRRLEKNPKIRIRISVPNSARVVRTSYIAIDSQLLSWLQSNQNSAGFAEIPVDITILCEYRHDVRVNHPNNLDFDVETSRGKAIGFGTVDLANVIQAPIETLLICRKDSATTASIKIEMHSLCISRTSPATAPEPSKVSVVLDESDSDLVLPMTRQVEQKISDALATNRIMVLNSRSSEGTIL
jgi:hypothetical protein